MDVKALGHLLDEKNHSLCLDCSSLQLCALVFWTSYLLLLRFLSYIIGSIGIFPESFQAHISRVESRIVNIAISMIQILSKKRVPSSLSFKGKYRLDHPRDGSFGSSFSPIGPADDLIAARNTSSLDSNGEEQQSQMFLHQPDIAYLRPQAPRPPYRRSDLENFNQSSSSWLSSSAPRAVANPTHGDNNNNSNIRRNITGYDGTASPPLPPEAIPAVPVRPLPAFLARVPFASISDSIYSSCSTLPPIAAAPERQNSSSLEGNAPTKVQTYTKLLPKWSFDDPNGPHMPGPSSSSSSSNKDNSSNDSTTAAAAVGNISSSRSTLDFSRNLSNRTRQDNNTLAAMAEHYARMNHRRDRRRNTRSSSAPVTGVNARGSKL